ncbi:MAG: biotin carboxylase N-terminal domain-containing protein, partial [Chromatiales bacterium]
MTRKFDSVLVANRGEIACRIIRSVRAMGMRSIAVYSEADAGAPHVTLADRSVCIGAGPPSESYLSIARVLESARHSSADAIHPGYGFLAENATFATACEDADIVFIGPSPHAISAMGNKAEAKRLMRDADVACVPGYDGADQSDAIMAARAAEIGFPIMIKAAAGGGGRGMRLVEQSDEMSSSLRIARSEAINAFGSNELILEKAIRGARHVEIQIVADNAGHTVHLGERDCSVQRRHQKLIEEAPCPVLTTDLREQMGAAAVRAARAIGYSGVGTVEFLLDQDGSFYFLEMNTRLQVEHPVTEMVTGLDLVELQIRVARGEALGLKQQEIALDGHAIEARLCTEDPSRDFMPATGTITRWHIDGS